MTHAIVRAFEAADLAAVHRLLACSGWSHRIHDVQHLARLIAASQRVVVAETDGRVVGFARAITDGISNGYLSMVVVAQDARRQGVGRALAEEIMRGDDAVTWVLRAGREGADAFFATLGFVGSTVAMERTRR
ncbi:MULTISPECIES: GNAT family N-acetyltransferase [unclassified Variovorax]|uniref:GNAT family N-acetyltransferase n=1 Tax=unclassified Variovorax TaxID=663243 RepID=UPI0008B84365|nr:MULTISPECIES: GNAT family N-acetyltransferase [unclassified Variovorax]SEK15770.1 Predicted N-acetyltransferase YhbS [Variovorax sp. OK202]SFE21265.1 Predicted N-acetyltransferase YhbS [Variovorax sp. OK212]